MPTTALRSRRTTIVSVDTGVGGRGMYHLLSYLRVDGWEDFHYFLLFSLISFVEDYLNNWWIGWSFIHRCFLTEHQGVLHHTSQKARPKRTYCGFSPHFGIRNWNIATLEILYIRILTLGTAFVFVLIILHSLYLEYGSVQFFPSPSGWPARWGSSPPSTLLLH